MTSESVPTRVLPAQKQRRIPELLRMGRKPPRTVDEQLEDLARASATYFPAIARRLGQHNRSQLVEDVWQNAFAKVTKRLREDAGSVDNLHAYMRQVCVNCAVDELRLIQRRSEILVGDGTAVLEDRENAELDASGVYYADIRDELKVLLTPMEHRAVFLTSVLDFTSERAAELMDVSPSSVRKALGRAREKVARRRPGLGQEA
ncbi:RNA polymerase sigma factor [Streptomyces sp. ML-6]|uniref:RNA polymerase sigma factor n=1 Tax=Streptomyces sp. ML-6 TaxID=2982693 RepID=UPI0024BFEB08|nr:RNA polymerase sigma factor [Streptomyces sp. ML-6]MDK0522148.1 RNA polymerase sigma factor [Streptomyces sp. ML-6]